MQRIRLLIVIGVLFTLSWSSSANAQTNLILNPGFEEELGWTNYTSDPADTNTRFDVPQSWGGWLGLSPHNADWMNIYPNVLPQIGWPRRSGNRAVTLSRGSATFTAALFQRVTVGTGQNVQGGAWAYSENAAGTARVGIDPNGGTNPYDSDIVWGNWVNGPNSNFFQTSAEATATGDAITIFLFATQSAPSDPNGVYWDDAYVYLGGNGGAVAGATPGGTVSGVPVVPTSPPAVAGFVQPQAPQADGSIVHTVQAGDTLAGIAFAYGVTVEQLQQQNNISNPRIISVGQQIIVQPAEGSGGSSNNTNNTAGSTDNGSAPSEDTGGEPIIASATPVPPTPTPAAPAPVREASENGVDPSQTTSELCIVLFEDSNQNRLQEEGENLLADGTITLSADGQTLQDEQTDASDALCFDALAAGDYVASASAPDGYGLTTPDQLQVRLAAGETLFVAFGAAEGVEIAAVPTANSQNVAPAENEGNPALTEETANSPLNLLIDNSGLIVFGLAGLVMVIGFGITLFGLLRRR